MSGLRHQLAHIGRAVALVAIVAGASGCTPAARTSGEPEECQLKLGFMGALSGANAGFVVPMRNGAALAVSQYTGDCAVTLVDYDTQGDPALAAPLAQDAVNDEAVVGIVGPAFSGETEATGQIFADANLPTLSPGATRPSLADRGWQTFHRGIGNDNTQGPAAGRYITDVLRAERVFLVNDDSAYGVALVDEVRRVIPPDVLAGEGEVKTGERTFPSVVTAVVDIDADVVFYGGYAAEAAPLLDQLRQTGWIGTLVGADGINGGSFLVIGAAAEGTIATCPCLPIANAPASFIDEYREANGGAEPDAFADVAYDLANIFLEGISAGHVTRSALQRFLTFYDRAGAATGVAYRWDARGELDASQLKVWTYKVVDGAWVPYQELSG